MIKFLKLKQMVIFSNQVFFIFYNSFLNKWF
ncbi:hypothetical protein X474_00115 [Dethiosulfatarculus sandiegensis]|uniref:Uncharacterized protein n=1 Tax=Dethiosulfatarculus sandiegensis TaxID=1429043 RepID=A0A0D2JCX9_9BACT|nr:hypothetical protein X474_00115 [Dethiosulfatarculus sandiegensis]